MNDMQSLNLRERFLSAMGKVASVNVVTTDWPAGRSGVTVSEMSSVSADGENPTILVCVNRQGTAAGPIVENGVFCVNILRDDQSYISDRFAGRHGVGIDKFSGVHLAGNSTGAPWILDSLSIGVGLDLCVLKT
jgi:flavin reductase (DIM6/NTAB) family NADH-FMN oxidoreductase RutF